LCAVNGLFFKHPEISPSCRSCIHNGSDPCPKGESIGRNTGWSIGNVSFKIISDEGVNMHVDKPWCHIQALGINDFFSIRYRNIGGNMGNLSIRNGNIHFTIYFIFGVNNMASF
jgi:hypothetical protein